jgi:putative tryptophan/tyrosine transport system substrate-binding protein
MRRRDFVTFFSGAAVASSIGARAQQQALPVIGYLVFGSAGVGPDRIRPFRQGLAEAGIIEGRDATIEIRRAEFQTERLPKLASELVSRGISVLAAPGNTAAALAAKASTTTIPIVFFVGGDPVQLGLVASLNRPGGNITGVTNLTVEVGPKRLELLHELIPAATVFALIVNPYHQCRELVRRHRAGPDRLDTGRAHCPPDRYAGLEAALADRLVVA